MLDDLRLALRRLNGSRGFMVVAVLTLAVVVGANVAILSIADAVLFRPLPFKDPDSVFLVMMQSQADGRTFFRVDNAFVDAINAGHPGLGDVGVLEGGPRIVVDTAEGAEVLASAAVSENYLRILGVTPRIGRMFAPGDAPGRAAMLSEACWRTRFGADPGIVGRTITLGNRSFEVIGILPREFSFQYSSPFGGRAELVTLLPPAPPGAEGGTFYPIVRLEPGVTRAQAQAQMARIAEPAWAARPATAASIPYLAGVRERVYPIGRDVMRFLLAAAILVLLVGCANLANMLLARGRRFERDLAVKASMGASRLRLVRPLIFEAVLIGAAGSGLALVVTALGFDVLLRQVPADAYRGARVGIDLRVALMGLGLGLGSGVLFAVIPALRAVRLDVLALLHGRHRGARSHWRVGRPMIAVQVALAVVLVFGATVAVRAFVSVMRTPLGFDPANVVRLDLVPPSGTTDVAGFYRRVVERLGVRPEVAAAGATGTPPLSNFAGWAGIRRPGTEDTVSALVHTLPGYFEAIGVRPSAGRLLRWDDAGTGGAVITEGAARALFGGASPVDRTIDAGVFGGQLHVVGVIPAPRNQMQEDAASVAQVHIIPTGRTTRFFVFAKLRSHDEPMLRALRRDAGDVATGVPVAATWWEDSLRSIAPVRDPRFQALVLGSFATIAVGLTGVGVFGIVAFLVASRTREMGIRLAIGASPGALVRMMVGQAVVPVGVGVAAGVLSARFAARWAESRFVSLDTSDPRTLVIAGAVVLAATVLAAFAPARRAARVNPTTVLKAE